MKEDLIAGITNAVQSQNKVDSKTIEVASHVKFCAKKSELVSRKIRTTTTSLAIF